MEWNIFMINENAVPYDDVFFVLKAKVKVYSAID